MGPTGRTWASTGTIEEYWPHTPTAPTSASPACPPVDAALAPDGHVWYASYDYMVGEVLPVGARGENVPSILYWLGDGVGHRGQRANIMSHCSRLWGRNTTLRLRVSAMVAEGFSE